MLAPLLSKCINYLTKNRYLYILKVGKTFPINKDTDKRCINYNRHVYLLGQ